MVTPVGRECSWKKTQTEKKRKRKKRDLPKMSQKPEIVSEIICSNGIPQNFQGPNVQRIGYLTEQGREIVSLLESANNS